MVGRIFASCIVGVVACLFVAQYDSWLKEVGAFYVCQQLEKNALCTAVGRLSTMSFFLPDLVFENIALESASGPQWRWRAERVSVSFSWWQFVRHGCLDVDVRLYGCCATSSMVDGTPAIISHVQQFFADSLLPIRTNMKLIELHESSLSLYDEERRMSGFFQFSSVTKKIGDAFKTMVTIRDGEWVARERQLFSRLEGKVASAIQIASGSQGDASKMEGSVDIRLDVPQLDRPACFVTGTWENKSGRFSIRNVQQLLTIEPCIVSLKDRGIYLDVVARFPLSYVWRLGMCMPDTNTVGGNCAMRMRGNVTGEGALDGHLAIEDVRFYDHLPCSALTITLHRLASVMQGAIKARARDVELGGSWNMNANGDAFLSLTNGQRFTVPGFSYWHADAGDVQCSVRRMADGLCAGTYDCTFRNAAYTAPLVSRGKLTYSNSELAWNGSVGDYRYQGIGSFLFPYVRSFDMRDVSGAPFASVFFSQQDHQWLGECSYPFLRILIELLSGTKVQGKGNVIFGAHYNDGAFCMQAHLNNGIIRLPHTYNFIDECKARLSWHGNERALIIEDMYFGLHTGTGHCVQGALQFDNVCKLEYMHIPIVFNRCLFNVKKDLFAMVSGHGVLSKKEGEASLMGRITIDRAQVKDTLFSFDASKTLFEKGFTNTPLHRAAHDSLWSETGLAMTVETKDVVHIDTPLVQADAHAHLTVAGTIADPTLAGDIVIDAGAITLPYKPLLITKGNIHFEPESTSNPFIELRAKNKIKKHLVTLYAYGFIADHQIVLDASPPLTEEQIIALLLVGSPEESLNVMMPTFIMHNLKMALWGSGSLSFLDNYLKKRRIPFSINLIPSFTDQTGRGGLRGGIEVTVNDRWRALIQKNFSLSEDTRFELEYLFSDDVGVRAVRDERRDIGGEVEMRWKF